MFARILTLSLALAACCHARDNVGLLLEWIEVDHQSASQLLQQFAEEDNANALRAELEIRLDQGQAKLVETSYLVTRPGQRAKVESHLEFIYGREDVGPEIPSPMRPPRDWNKPKRLPGIIGLPVEPIGFDVENLGTELEVEPLVNDDGTLAINIASERRRHIADRNVGDPKFALNGNVQPTFRNESSYTNFTATDGDDFLVDLLTPKNDGDRRIFLIARATLLAPKRKPQPRDIHFKKIPAGTTLTIDHYSSGCFHNTGTRLVIDGKKVTVSDLVPKEKLLGTYTIAEGDLEKLAKTLQFYRDIDGSGGCTTIEEVSLKLHRDGKLIAREKYTDGSCSIDDQEGILTFDELLERLEP